MMAFLGTAGAGGSASASDDPLPPRDLVPKLDSSLAAVAREGAGRADSLDIRRQGDLVRVVVEASSVDRARTMVRDVGGRVGAGYENLLRAWVPPSGLRALAASPAVAYVRPPVRVRSDDLYWNQAAAAARAVSWRLSGWTGLGVKVAVIDVGFGANDDLVARGELPASAPLVNYCGAGSDSEHGTGVAASLYETAPGVDLTMICVDDEIGLGQAEEYVEDHGIGIVNHSVSWFGAATRGDGSGEAGTPDAIVARAAAHGILWVNSAGNQAQSHWGGTFYDPNGNGFEDFSSLDEREIVGLPAGYPLCAFLRWDDWPTSAVDYDLYISRTSTGQIVAQSTNPQTGTQAPVESVCYVSSTSELFSIKIRKVSGDGSPRLDLFVPGFGIDHYTPEGSISEPGASPSTLAVGAMCNAGAAAWPPQIEPYSGQGPTVDGRTKPDVTGFDGYGSPVRSLNTEMNGFCGPGIGFLGTSAAAPIIAATAALVQERNPSYNADDLRSYIETNVEDVGTPGPDSVFGSGFLRLPGFSPQIWNTRPTVTVKYGGLLDGVSLAGATSVTWNGTEVDGFVSFDNIMAFWGLPDDATTGHITVTTPLGTAVSDEMTVEPTLTDFTPGQGPPGTHVTLIGSGFAGATSVTMGDTPLSFTIVSPTKIDAVIPSDPSGEFTVTANGLSAHLRGKFMVVTTPIQITSFSPTAAPWGGSVHVYGSGFFALTGAALAGKPAETTILSDTELILKVPAGVPTSPIVVGGYGYVETKQKLTILPTIAAISPSSGPTGTVVTITGTGLYPPGSASIGKTVIKNFFIEEPTRAVLTIPETATSGAFRVKTTGGTVTSIAVFAVTPVIAKVSPGSGKVGRSVKITGSGLGAVTSVTFNGIAAAFKATATAISTKVPAGATTGPIVVTAPAGSASSPTDFIVTG